MDIVLLTKYLGQLFWWLYAKRKDAKEGKGHDISDDKITLTVITVREPKGVIKELRRILGNQLTVRYHGHYQWHVMGVEIHLVVINQLPVTHEHYAWLSFAEGTKYQQYRENLVQDIQQNAAFQVYLELLQELEEEGKERMANEVLKRIMMKMPPEKRQEILNDIPSSEIQQVLKSFSAEKLREVLEGEKLREVLEGLPKDQLQEILKGLSATRQ